MSKRLKRFLYEGRMESLGAWGLCGVVVRALDHDLADQGSNPHSV